MIDDDQRARDDGDTAQEDTVQDDEYLPDPDAAPTVEGRVAQARVELNKLLTSSALATVGIGSIIAVVDAVRGSMGFPNTAGFLLGAVMATVNLWLLAGGYFALMRGEAMSARAVIAFLGSFAALVMVSIFVVTGHREWTLGFALGLTTPAVAGLLYARTLR